jgi:diphthine synthase
MTINQCIEQLLEIEEMRCEKVYSENTIGVGVSRIGSDDQQIVCGTFKELLQIDFGKPLHSFIIAGKMHFLEAETLSQYAVNKETFKQFAHVDQGS